MKTYLDCIPCFLKQGLFAARIAGLGQDDQKKVLDDISKIIPDIPLESSPPEIAMDVYKVVREISGLNDPYKRIKKKYISLALNLYPELKRIVNDAEDPLLAAIRVAIAGNIIDFGVGNEFNVEESLKDVMRKEFAILDYEFFKQDLLEADKILYIGDNAGETVFDRVLIEEMKGKVIYAVRGKPIINDAIIEDARRSGIGEVAEIISSGSPAPGTILSRCSKKFLNIFNRADLVISKGQGNYESLSEIDKEIFFLLKAKCPVIARDIGVGEGSIILMKQKCEDKT